MEDVMNIGELALYLNMSIASVYHLVAAGKIPGVKVGKQWRFSRKVIDDWLQNSGKKPVSVLVVEDDPVIRNLVVGVLQKAGHHCIGAECVKDARTLLEDIEFNVVFLDLLLPDGTGLDVVESAAKLSVVPEITIITGHPDHEMIESVRALLPYVTILNKPVKLETLLELTARSSRASA